MKIKSGAIAAIILVTFLVAACTKWNITGHTVNGAPDNSREIEQPLQPVQAGENNSTMQCSVNGKIFSEDSL